ncbi:hypothetical protein [Embleya sp. NPDC020630]|uniref:Orn/Lys/Arg family decarboxylase n=1 Tax=Embleya sp. NPDC020630 TaxID=3363979 RepID=UPI0037A24AF8
MTDFKALYDDNAPLTAVLPDVVAQFPGRYAEQGLRELCRDMHDHPRGANLVELLDTAFRDLPVPVAPPQRCCRELVRGGTQRVALAEAAGRVAAAMVTVTPPGIAVPMPGESIGAADGPLLRYLGALEAFDRHFPGFHSETHGVVVDPENGDYRIECVHPDRENALGG